VLGQSPALHKVIPVEKSIPVEVQVFPYEQASALMDKAKSFGVLKCICKVQKSLIGEPCEYPEEVCLVFSSAEDAFKDNTTIRTLTKEEALQILRETEEAGLIHSSTNIREGHFYICNCCPCCCGIIRGLSQFGVENSVAKSDYYAVVDPETCIGCSVCLDRCHFGASSLQDDVSHVDEKRCIGCGLCVITCPSGAMKLVRKPENEITSTPRNRGEWMKERAENRGISLQEVL
jgi:ferredoxin